MTAGRPHTGASSLETVQIIMMFPSQPIRGGVSKHLCGPTEDRNQMFASDLSIVKGMILYYTRM